MRSTSFGYVIPSGAGGDVPPPETILGLAREADDSPLSHLWVSDHLLWWHPMYESLTLLSALAARTERIGLGVAVLLVSLRSTLSTAKSLATIDRLSGGRLTVGVGIGGEFPPEWEAAGVPRAERAHRTEVAVDRMRSWWSGERISGVELHPRLSNPPPIWVGGRSEAAVRRAARLGDGWMGIFLTPQRFAERAALLAAECERQGRPGEDVPASLYAWTCIGDSDDEARRIAETTLGAFYNLPFEKLERFAIIGSPDTCLERFGQFTAAGARHFAVAPIWPEATSEPLRRLAELVGAGKQPE